MLAAGRLSSDAYDERLPLLLVTSWNEWNEDTAIQPVAETPPTSVDDTTTGTGLTQGHAYAGHGSAYLEVLRRRFGAGNPLR